MPGEEKKRDQKGEIFKRAQDCGQIRLSVGGQQKIARHNQTAENKQPQKYGKSRSAPQHRKAQPCAEQRDGPGQSGRKGKEEAEHVQSYGL